MAYDETLAERIRLIMAGTASLVEKKMFGGLGFLVNGHLAASAYKSGELMIRCSPDDWAAFCTEPGARAMERKGKAVSGWVIIAIDAVIDDSELTKWVQRGQEYATSQPPK